MITAVESTQQQQQSSPTQQLLPPPFRGLQAECKRLGLKASGSTAALKKRLKDHTPTSKSQEKKKKAIFCKSNVTVTKEAFTEPNQHHQTPNSNSHLKLDSIHKNTSMARHVIMTPPTSTATTSPSTSTTPTSNFYKNQQLYQQQQETAIVPMKISTNEHADIELLAAQVLCQIHTKSSPEIYRPPVQQQLQQQPFEPYQMPPSQQHHHHQRQLQQQPFEPYQMPPSQQHHHHQQQLQQQPFEPYQMPPSQQHHHHQQQLQQGYPAYFVQQQQQPGLVSWTLPYSSPLSASSNESDTTLLHPSHNQMFNDLEEELTKPKKARRDSIRQTMTKNNSNNATSDRRVPTLLRSAVTVAVPCMTNSNNTNSNNTASRHSTHPRKKHKDIDGQSRRCVISNKRQRLGAVEQIQANTSKQQKQQQQQQHQQQQPQHYRSSDNKYHHHHTNVHKVKKPKRDRGTVRM